MKNKKLTISKLLINLINSHKINHRKKYILIESIFIILILQLLFRKVLFSLSISYIKHLRITYSIKFILFFENISFLVKDEFLIFINIFFFIIFSSDKAIKLTKSYFFSKYVNSILKSVFRGERPFWSETRIFYKCHGGYGFPSAHSCQATCFFLTACKIICDFIQNNYFKIIFKLISIIIIVLVGYSRIVLSYHSIDQVIFGYAYGGFLFYYANYFKDSNEENKENSDDNFKEDNIEEERNYLKLIINNTIKIIIGIFFSFILCFLFNNEQEKFKYYEMSVKYHCQNLINTTPLYKEFCISLSIIGYFACNFGEIFCRYFWDIYRNNESHLLEIIKTYKQKNSFVKGAIFYLGVVLLYYFLLEIFKIKNFIIVVFSWSFILGFFLYGPFSVLKTIYYNEEVINGDSVTGAIKLDKLKYNDDDDSDEENKALI